MVSRIVSEKKKLQWSVGGPAWVNTQFTSKSDHQGNPIFSRLLNFLNQFQTPPNPQPFFNFPTRNSKLKLSYIYLPS